MDSNIVTDNMTVSAFSALWKSLKESAKIKTVKYLRDEICKVGSIEIKKVDVDFHGSYITFLPKGVTNTKRGIIIDCHLKTISTVANDDKFKGNELLIKCLQSLSSELK